MSQPFLEDVLSNENILFKFSFEQQKDIIIQIVELINANLFNDFDVLLSLLKPIENKDIKSLMTIINDSIFNNIMKYNLNKKVIKIDKIDEKLKEYLDGFKLNIQNYQNRVEDFIEELKVKEMKYFQLSKYSI